MKKKENKGNFKVALNEIMKGNLSASDKYSLSAKKETPKDPVDSIKTVIKPVVSNQEVKHSVSTIISEDTIIEGSIKSKSDLIVKGRVIGDIESDKSINICGNVEGNVKSSSTVLLEGLVNGNLSSNGLLKISKDSKIVGDVECQVLETNGIITGNINAKESVNIGSNSVIEGNISSKTLTVEEGSKIKGLFEITSNLE